MMSGLDRQNSVRPPARPARVVLADDECMFRSSLRHLLTAPPAVIAEVYGVQVDAGFEVVGEAGSGEETIAVVQAAKPDLLLLDLSMPRLSGLEALSELEAQRASTRTILLSGMIDRTHLLTAVQLGVRGLVMKDAPTESFFEAIVSVMNGQFWLGQSLVNDLVELVRSLSQPAGSAGEKPKLPLTPRQREVLGLVVAGHTNKEIATKFSVSEETVKHHLTRMFDKVGASNRLDLAMKASKNDLAKGAEAANSFQ
jgi:two-component system, NarL family, nitrate/nitrite response regulator NarL